MLLYFRSNFAVHSKPQLNTSPQLMPDKIYCLMNGGRSLTDDDRNLLFHTARKVWHSTKNRQVVKTDTMEGLITTTRQYARLGGTLGVKFSATLATNEGNCQVEYIVRPGQLEPADLDDAVWGHLPREVYHQLTEMNDVCWN